MTSHLVLMGLDRKRMIFPIDISGPNWNESFENLMQQ